MKLLIFFLPLGKITGGESVRVTGCVCHDETSDKFRFSVTGADISSGETGGEMVTYNIQVSVLVISHFAHTGCLYR